MNYICKAFTNHQEKRIMIAAEILEKYGAVKKSFEKSDIIFEEGNSAFISKK